MTGFFLVNLLIVLLVKVQGQIFCFVLCDTANNCNSFAYNQCKGCATGFQKATNTGQYACIAQSTSTYITSNNPRYQPIGTSDDITYNLMSNLTVVNMTLTTNGSSTKV
jgi:hypothetical protein